MRDQSIEINRHRKKYGCLDELWDRFVLVLIRWPIKPYSTAVPLLSFSGVLCWSLTRKLSLLGTVWTAPSSLKPNEAGDAYSHGKEGKGSKSAVRLEFGITAANGITKAHGGASWTNERTALLSLLCPEYHTASQAGLLGNPASWIIALQLVFLSLTLILHTPSHQ